MSGLFIKFDKYLHKVDVVLRILGTETEQFLPTKIRIDLIDQLVHDALDNRNRMVLIQDLLRNGCVGFCLMPDLELMNALHSNILDDGIPDEDYDLPPIIEVLSVLLENYERKLLDD